jgi:hypothetical protein
MAACTLLTSDGSSHDGPESARIPPGAMVCSGARRQHRRACA